MATKSQLWSKWFKHKVLLECKELAPYLPETHLYSPQVMWDLLKRYNTVMIKPSKGGGGKGILKVTKTGQDSYEIRSRFGRRAFKGKGSAENYLAETLNKKRSYVVQQYIPLAKADGGVMDFRYVAQRVYGDSEWEITIWLAKIAQPGNFLTNVARGATPVFVKDALMKSNVRRLGVENIMSDLEQVTLKLADCLTRYFEDHIIWGFDLGVDENGHVWLIEANSAPAVKGLKELDKGMHERVMYYKEMNEKL